MRKARVIRSCAVMAMLAVAAASTTAQTVSYGFDKTADFSAFRTFTFRTGTKSDNPLVDQRVITAITSVLGARGMIRDNRAPNVAVVTHLTFDKSKDISAWSTASSYGRYGWGWGIGLDSSDIRVHDILSGTLVVDVIDIAKGRLVWRGIGEKEVRDGRKSSSVNRNVDKAVIKIFRSYPLPSSS